MSKYRNNELATYASMCKALGNSHRLSVFLRLAKCCAPGTRCEVNMRTCVGDLAAGLDLAPSTVSHHLKELSRNNLIHMERSGQNVECWVDPKTLEALSGFFQEAGRR